MAVKSQPLDDTHPFEQWAKKHQGAPVKRIHAKLDRFSGNTPNAEVGAAAKELAELILSVQQQEEKSDD